MGKVRGIGVMGHFVRFFDAKGAVAGAGGLWSRRMEAVLPGL